MASMNNILGFCVKYGLVKKKQPKDVETGEADLNITRLKWGN